MARIFITYAHDGLDLAKELQQALETDHHSVFIQSDDMDQADLLTREIKSCDLFITLMTPAATESQGAYQTFKLAENHKKPILPIAVDSGLPPYLMDSHSINLKGTDITPIVREIELMSLGIGRRRERKLFMFASILAIMVISFLLLRPRFEIWYAVTFNPTVPSSKTPSPTATINALQSPILMTATQVAVIFNATSTDTSERAVVTSVESSGQIVFHRVNRDDDQFTRSIFVIDLDTEVETRLTDITTLDSLPVWSPDGSQIVFVSDRDGNLEIYIMDEDGDNQTRLTGYTGVDTSPAWSPDGSQIAFVSDREGGSDIFVMNADGSNVFSLISSNRNLYEPAWSPDGSQFTFESNQLGRMEIFLVDIDRGDQRSINSDTQQIQKLAAWSPDGSQIAFVSGREGGSEIFVMNLDGNNQIRLTSNTANDSFPAWSPDGSQIVFVSDRDGNQEIYIMNADGSDQQRITNTPEDEWNPSWRP